MPYSTQPDADNVLRPETPEDFAVLFDILEQELAADIAGDRENVIRPLALLGVRHLAGHTGLRCLLHGESGSGKTWAAKALARHLGAPYVRVSMPDTAETTWRGVDITNHIDAMRRGLLRPGISSDAATALANRAVVLVDDMDVMRLEPFQSYGDSDKGQRAGRQSSLVNCWAGEDMMIDEGAWIWSARSALVIGAGQFDGLQEALDGSALIRWGMIPPLAERIAMGAIVQMPLLAAADLCAVAAREALQLCAPAFSAFGYTLIISPEAVRRAVNVVRERDHAAGVRAVTGLLRRVADRTLIQAVSQAAPVGARITLAPDDM
ncbi:MAG: ATP-binding protein [Longimicrobiales bacterium]